MAQMLTERYRERMHGVLSCYDRIVITGPLPGICYAGGVTSFLYAQCREVIGLQVLPAAFPGGAAARVQAPEVVAGKR